MRIYLSSPYGGSPELSCRYREKETGLGLGRIPRWFKERYAPLETPYDVEYLPDPEGDLIACTEFGILGVRPFGYSAETQMMVVCFLDASLLGKRVRREHERKVRRPITYQC